MTISDGETRAGCAATIAWSLLCGFALAALFAAGIFGIAYLFPNTELLVTPTAHGAYGVPPGSYVLLFGTPILFLVGILIGAAIASSR
ncbi:hypothetical protein [Aporhodopirellula aestuarii]|uniref:Cox cluster protein n=1 Tax=Aporhodopirellula aestuarii TaxID=2950107 RepID=A0ABT0U6P9_9BACT|nr:hypothetical protein [Aporhodopirellula aestuarii]MCM2372354.1 hypothetical protein [Aporhodopirellula aestuarii]